MVTMKAMTSVTIKDINVHDLDVVASRAAAAGMSTQEFLRRLIAQEAARPALPDELRDLAAKRRAGRKPMAMSEFNRVRRSAVRSS
jgi:predicted DsbA family dithiol-disulfide isomerase